jgi:hypothetical protein
VYSMRIGWPHGEGAWNCEFCLSFVLDAPGAGVWLVCSVPFDC